MTVIPFPGREPECATPEEQLPAPMLVTYEDLQTFFDSEVVPWISDAAELDPSDPAEFWAAINRLHSALAGWAPSSIEENGATP